MKNYILILLILLQGAFAFFWGNSFPDCRPDIRPFNEKENRVRITGKWRERRVKHHSEYRHSGIDYSLPMDTPIIATGKGKVIHSRYTFDYGNLIIIDHGTWWDKEKKQYISVKSKYAHLNEYLVLKGQWVEKGQLIGLCGDTGRSSGNHIHLEVLINDNNVWPGYFMARRKREEKERG